MELPKVRKQRMRARDAFRGCNCKRSGCMKKYCDCFNGGVLCSGKCKCIGCFNNIQRQQSFNVKNTFIQPKAPEISAVPSNLVFSGFNDTLQLHASQDIYQNSEDDQQIIVISDESLQQQEMLDQLMFLNDESQQPQQMFEDYFAPININSENTMPILLQQPQALYLQQLQPQQDQQQIHTQLLEEQQMPQEQQTILLQQTNLNDILSIEHAPLQQMQFDQEQLIKELPKEHNQYEMKNSIEVEESIQPEEIQKIIKPTAVVTLDEINAIVSCLIARAEECTEMELSDTDTDRLILIEMGKCIQQLIAGKRDKNV